MCGIVGIASQQPVADRGVLVSGRDALRHRGPDDAGEWWSPDGRVGLGHRRLSIIDLSPAGHQPMANAAGDLVMVFNGEIYNFRELRDELQRAGYKFRSTSDTEVLLLAYEAWGEECVSRLTGMFAFAIHDVRRQVIFAGRDRAGEKPLFYLHISGDFRFSSELKGLLVDSRLPRRIDYEALDCYLALGYVPGARCMLAGYSKLPPAHVLRFDLQNGSLSVRRYWQLPESDISVQRPVDEGALLDELEVLLEGAVKRQMVADVPLGVLLRSVVSTRALSPQWRRETQNGSRRSRSACPDKALLTRPSTRA